MNTDSLHTWLINQSNAGKLKTKDSVFIDVGAYRGEFSQQMLINGDIAKAILFEANQDNYANLQSTFVGEPKIELINYAVGDVNTKVIFNCDSDLATGSVLPYQYSLDDLNSIKKQEIDLITLDYYFEKNPLAQKISAIKIDTQGFDLNVLKGAAQTIAYHQPWLIVELIFAPLYQNQSNPHLISTWLESQGYTLAGLFNIHYSSEGYLAFADGIFTPSEITASFNGPFHQEQSVSQLLAENAMLRATCEERLELINRLHNKASLFQKNKEKLKSLLRM